jgi:hypothetical protein
MQAFSVEESIMEGEKEVKELFEFVKDNAWECDAYEIEKSIFSRVMKIGLSAMKCYFAEKGTGDKGPQLELKDAPVLQLESTLRGRDYFSVFGKLKVPRSCYRTEGQEGIMPLDAEANLPQRSYSYLLQQWMDLLSIRDSFGESEITLQELLGLTVSQSRFEVVSHETKSHYDEFYHNKETPSAESEGEIEVLGFDGIGVPMIKKEAAKIQARLGKGEKRQKKKEAMVGVSYTVNSKERTAEEVAESLVYPEKARDKKSEKKDAEKVRAQNIRRFASLERSRQEVIEEIVKDAKKRDPAQKRPWVVVMDGALNLWKLVFIVLGNLNFVGILDIIHVVEYLWVAANALYDEKAPERKKWVYEHLLSLLQGRVGRVIGGLKQTLRKRKLKVSQRKALKDVIRYFENHREWMRYDEYLSKGYPIGSGVVESSCGHTVKDRMEGTGRRWSVEGAESVLLLRSIYTSGDWDMYWDSYMKIERKRVYGKVLDTLNLSEESSNLEQVEDSIQTSEEALAA